MESVSRLKWLEAGGWFVYAGAAWLALQAILSSIYFFLNDCTSPDVLNWDANIRYVLTFDQYKMLQRGEIFSALGVFLEGSTWPPLYSVLTLALFLAWPGGPNTILAIVPGFLFYVALFPSAAFLAWRLTDKTWKGGLLFFLFTVFLIHTHEFQAYALSAMLETMGMFFLLWTLYFLMQVQEHDEASAGTKWGLAISAGGLFLAKYPFGIMLAFAWAVLVLARHYPSFWSFLLYLWEAYILKNGLLVRSVRIALPLATVFSLLALLSMGLMGAGEINKKLYKYAIYTFSALFFLDFSVFLFRNQKKLPLPFWIQNVYAWAFFPGFVWIFLHPDRFSGVIGGQFWFIKETSSFFKSLFLNVFSFPLVFSIFVLLAVLAIVLRAIVSKNKDRTFWQRSDFQIFLLLFLQIALQEVFSPNKQHRHIYYLVPAVLFFSGYWILQLNLLEKNLFLRIFLVLFLFALGLIQLTGSTGLWSNYQGRHFCYAGRDAGRFEPVRELARVLDPSGSYILINALHSIPAGNLSLATEVDVLFRSRLDQKGTLVNDSRRLRRWQPDQEILYVSQSCNGLIAEDVQKSATRKAQGALLLLQSEKIAEGLCLQRIQLAGKP